MFHAPFSENFKTGCFFSKYVSDPDFYPSRIPDPGSRIQQQQQKKGWGFVILPFCSHKFHKIENYFIFEQVPGTVPVQKKI